MRSAPYLFAILFIGFFFYLGFNNFELPTFFLFEDTEKTKGIITKTGRTHLGKGYYLQLLYYEYEVKDSVYEDYHNVGQREGQKSVGDKLLIEYSIENPEKNEVIGYYRKKSKYVKPIKLKTKN